MTFAACSMASIELATQLPYYAQYLIGSEIDVLEVLDVSFRFASLMQVTDAMTDREVSWAARLAHARGVPTERPRAQGDAMMEYPTTWTDLAGMPAIAQRFNQLSQNLEALPQDKRDVLHAAIKTQAELIKGASERFIDSLRKAGKSQAVIDLITTSSACPPKTATTDLELGQVLNLLHRDGRVRAPSCGRSRPSKI